MAGPITIHRPVHLGNKMGAMGTFECETRRIRVQATLSRQVAIAVMLHEAVHAALYDAGLHFEEVNEEQLCDSVASAMMHLIRWAYDAGLEAE
jgi:hypothetical protein